MQNIPPTGGTGTVTSMSANRSLQEQLTAILETVVSDLTALLSMTKNQEAAKQMFLTYLLQIGGRFTYLENDFKELCLKEEVSLNIYNGHNGKINVAFEDLFKNLDTIVLHGLKTPSILERLNDAARESFG